jgi:hypothetical protein
VTLDSRGCTSREQKSADTRRSRKSAGHGAKPEAVRERAILALLSAKTLGAAADRCGVDESTLRRWMAEERFRSELAEARRAAFQAGMDRVQALTAEAVETLAALMAPDVPAAVRLGAARTVAELGLHQHDADTIMKKLDEIEAYQRQQETGRR